MTATLRAMHELRDRRRAVFAEWDTAVTATLRGTALTAVELRERVDYRYRDARKLQATLERLLKRGVVTYTKRDVGPQGLRVYALAGERS